MLNKLNKNHDDQDDNNDNDVSDVSDDNYIIKAKICKRLSTELGLEEIKFDEIGIYDVPKEHGLSNCNMIIPSYYQLHKHPSKIFTLDYFEMIKDDVRNLRELNKYQLEYIKSVSHECKNELLDIYNECSKLLNIVINEIHE